MSDKATDTLRLLEKLTRAAGGTGRPIHADVATEEYDWHVPFHFNGEQMDRLAEVGGVLARKVAQALGLHLCSEVKLTVEGPAQQFGTRLIDKLADTDRYQVVLSAGDSPCGLLLST